MTDRATIKQLEAFCDRINIATGSPEAPYARDAQGKLTACVGNYHISQAYGGVSLQRMCNEHGGVTSPLGLGHVTKRELRDQLRAFIAGLETASQTA